MHLSAASLQHGTQAQAWCGQYMASCCRWMGGWTRTALQAKRAPGHQLPSKYDFMVSRTYGWWVGAGAEMVWATYGALLSPEGWLDQEAHESDLRGSRGVALAGALMIFMGVANFRHTARPPHAGPCMTAVPKVHESLQWLALALEGHLTCTLVGQCRACH